MDAVSVLVIVALVAAIAMCAVAVFALFEAIATLRSARTFFDEMDGRLVPLIEKVDITVDAVNAELLRVDGIVTQFQEVADNVTTATHVVRDAANAPAGIANAVGTGVRRLVRDLKK